MVAAICGCVDFIVQIIHFLSDNLMDAKYFAIYLRA